MIISFIILAKYKPQFEVCVNNKKIGYINSRTDIDKYIEEEIEKLDKNIAFVELKNIPEMKLKLVSRGLDEEQETIKQEIVNNLDIEYTNYAIAVDGKNKTYVSNEEDAQNIIDEIKKKYSKEYTDKLTILQVYSEDSKQISAVEVDNAKDIINKEIEGLKKSSNKKTNTVKVANKSNKATKVTKVSSVKGIKLSVRPVAGIITSRFGRRTSPGGIGSTNHKGLDISAKLGTTIKASASGTVVYSGNKGALGKLVIIDHGNGVQTCYGHCSKLIAKAGEKVSAGDKIAEVGKTGSATGYHLHFEVRINGTSVNPQKYIY